MNQFIRATAILLLFTCLMEGAVAQAITGKGFIPDENGTNLDAPKPNVADTVIFDWPASGPLLAGFDESKNKGLDIGGKAGDPVSAAAEGRVVYAGDALQGYGKLILVKHNNTFLTAYAHNQTLAVKEGQLVKRGQKIAEMGKSGSKQIKLHFEIRREGKPIDPLQYLPAQTNSKKQSGLCVEYDCSYLQLEKEILVNLVGSKKMLSLQISLMTQYDDRVFDNVKRHESAIRGAIGEAMQLTTEADLINPSFRRNLSIKLLDIINGQLEKYEDFGGIAEVFFTSLVVQ